VGRSVGHDEGVELHPHETHAAGKSEALLGSFVGDDSIRRSSHQAASVRAIGDRVAGAPLTHISFNVSFFGRETMKITASAIGIWLLLTQVASAQANSICAPEVLPVLHPQGGFAFGLNDHGTIVGSARPSEEEYLDQAVVYRDGQVRLLPRYPGATRSKATAVNNAELIVGDAITDERGQFPVFWRRGRAEALQIPEGALGGTASAVNSKGQILGEAFFDGSTHCLFWDRPNAAPSDVGGDCSAIALNDRGTVLAQGGESGNFLWEGGAVRALSADRRVDLNDDETSVGSVYYPGEFAFRPAMWTRDSKLTVFDYLGGYSLGINDRGDVVISQQDNQALLIDRRGRVFDLQVKVTGVSFTINDRRRLIWNSYDPAVGIRAHTCQVELPRGW
jgi:hypothetical protein